MEGSKHDRGEEVDSGCSGARAPNQKKPRIPLTTDQRPAPPRSYGDNDDSISANNNKNELRRVRAELEQLRTEMMRTFTTLVRNRRVEWGDVPERLKTDRDLILLAIDVGLIQHKQDITNECLMDSEIVTALVRKRRVEWSEIPENLKTDRDLILLAIDRYLIRSKQDIKKECLKDSKIVLKLIHKRCEGFNLLWNKPPRVSKHKFSWNDLPEVSKHDPEVVLEALRYGFIPCWDDIPEKMQKDKEITVWGLRMLSLDAADVPWVDRDFVLFQLESGKIWWRDLPPEFRTDLELAKSLPNELLKREKSSIFQNIPDLRKDRGFWERIITCCHDSEEELYQLVSDFAAESLLSDRDMMLLAVNKAIHIVRCVHDQVIGDPHFFGHILMKDPSALRFLRADQIIPHTDLMIQHLPSLSKKLLACEIQNYRCPLTAEAFENRQFLEAWLRSGLPWPMFPSLDVHEDDQSLDLEDDREICLLIAKHCHKSHRLDSFQNATATLRQDHDFMRQAIDHDPALLACAEESLKWDNELRLKAVGSSEECYHRYVEEARLYRFDRPGSCQMFVRAAFDEKQRELKQDVAEALIRYKQFFVVLCGMRESNCILSLLQPTDVKRTIAEYLDIPRGERLRLLRQAEKNFRSERPRRSIKKPRKNHRSIVPVSAASSWTSRT